MKRMVQIKNRTYIARDIQNMQYFAKGALRIWLRRESDQAPGPYFINSPQEIQFESEQEAKEAMEKALKEINL